MVVIEGGPPLPQPLSRKGRGEQEPLPCSSSSPLAGEEGTRAEGVGRRGGGLSRARLMRRAPTEAERVLWRLLRNKRLVGWKFKRQQPIGRYIADFVCFEARLIVEADGSQHLDNAHDARRDAWLRAQPFDILRFWNNDILARPESVLSAIVAALDGTDGRAGYPPQPHPHTPNG